MKKYLIFTIAISTFLMGCKKEEDNSTVTDKIRSSLVTSLAAYDAASSNSWVPVTASEYVDLLTKVSGTTISGASESQMAANTTNGWSADYTVGADTNHTQLPASSFVIALSVRTGIFNSTSLGAKLKVSSSRTSGYTAVGGLLPDVGTIAANTRLFFILKTPVDKTAAAPNFLGMYNPTGYFLGSRDDGTTKIYYASGDSPTLSLSDASKTSFQVLSTQTKQW